MTDILPEAVLLSRRYARGQRLEGQGPGLVHSEVEDGRALSYADASFDAAYSVSVLEHIGRRRHRDVAGAVTRGAARRPRGRDRAFRSPLPRDVRPRASI